MNPNGISHRLFVAALAQDGPAAVKRPSAARSAAPNGPVKIRPTKSSQAFGALASQRLSEWSWSGWQHTTI
jgi:hypothetical protein